MQKETAAAKQSAKRGERPTEMENPAGDCDVDVIVDRRSGVRRPLRVRIGGWVANLFSWYRY